MEKPITKAKKNGSKTSKRVKKETKKQKRLRKIAEKKNDARSAGWEQQTATPIRFIGENHISMLALPTDEFYEPLDCFKLLWTPNLHAKWISQASAKMTRSYRGLADQYLISTGWDYIGTHLDFIASPHSTLREHWLEKPYLPSRDLMLDLHARRDSVEPFTLASLLSDNFCAYVDIGSQVTIDEIVAPSHLKSAAVSVIPRKPHPKGVLVWAAAVKLLDQNPYVLRMVPKTEDYVDWATEEIVEYLVGPLDNNIKRNFTMDSWFDSKAVRAYLTNNGRLYTLGAHTARQKDFWDQAKHGLLPHSWKQYYNSNTKQIASVFSDEGVHCCMSTAYRPMTRLTQELDRCPLSDMYKKYYNVVDLFNRNFYRTMIPHKKMSVTKVLFDACMQVTLVNARALYVSQDNASSLSLQEFISKCRDAYFGL